LYLYGVAAPAAAPAISTIYYTNIASDTRRAKAAAGRVTQRSSPMVAIATAASAAVVDTATGAKPLHGELRVKGRLIFA
jgi:hypothetical protein